MPPMSQARQKINKARFFIDQASKRVFVNREEFVTYVEAAIVFARSVTFCLQNEFKQKTGFDDWYEQKQIEMREGPIFPFFRDKRNYILKEGSVRVQTVTSIHIQDTMAMSDFCEVKVIRGKPWYRRSLRILWADFRDNISQQYKRWKWKRDMKRRQKREKDRFKVVEVKEGYYFDDPTWKGRDVFDIFEEYLIKIEKIVDEAEKKFADVAS